MLIFANLCMPLSVLGTELLLALTSKSRVLSKTHTQPTPTYRLQQQYVSRKRSLNFLPRSMYTRKLAAELMQLERMDRLIMASKKGVLLHTDLPAADSCRSFGRSNSRKVAKRLCRRDQCLSSDLFKSARDQSWCGETSTRG